jgi:hypothetical protein
VCCRCGTVACNAQPSAFRARSCLDWRGAARPAEPSPARRAQGWFDDKVEARNAVVRVAQIFDLRGLDRRQLPWCDPGDRRPLYWTKSGFAQRLHTRQMEQYPLWGPEGRSARGLAREGEPAEREPLAAAAGVGGDAEQ